MKEDFNKLLAFPNESYSLTNEKSYDKKIEMCNTIFDTLHIKNKKDIIEILKTNRLSKEVKEILTEEETIFLKKDNQIFKFDYTSIICILQAEMKLSFQNKINQLYKENNLY